ncbi:MAG: hypothetical protein AAGK97_18025, partial [Bacteroidota bacterium]
TGENLGPVAMFTYYVKETSKSPKKERMKQEGKDAKTKKDNPYPSYEDLKAERDYKSDQLVFTIKDASGNVVRKLFKNASKGVNRMQWDLRFAPKDAISLSRPSFYNPFAGKKEGTLVAPGDYTVEMDMMKNGELVDLDLKQNFTIKSLNNTVLPAKDIAAKIAFQNEVEEFSRSMQGANSLMREINNKMRYIKEAVKVMDEPIAGVLEPIKNIEDQMRNISTLMNGDRILSRLDIDQKPSPNQRLGMIRYEQKYSTAEPTKTHIESLAIAKEEFEPIYALLKKVATQELPALEDLLEKYKAPYTPGRALKMMQGQ